MSAVWDGHIAAPFEMRGCQKTSSQEKQHETISEGSMTQEEIAAIPDEVWREAHDVVWPSLANHLGKAEKIREAPLEDPCRSVARLIMENRAKDAEIAALKGDDPDLLAARNSYVLGNATLTARNHDRGEG